MKYYQEITLLSGEDVSANFLMSKIFQKVHLAKAEKIIHQQIMQYHFRNIRIPVLEKNYVYLAIRKKIWKIYI